MKRLFRAAALVLFFTFVSMNAGLATENPASPGSALEPANQAGQPTAAALLAAQVGEISRARLMSHAKKEKRIATAVRVAVVAATAYKSSAETLNIASELAAAAAAAAPQFKDVIVNAAVFTPSVTRIDGASGQIRAAANYAAANAGRTNPAPAAPPAVTPAQSTSAVAVAPTPAGPASAPPPAGEGTVRSGATGNPAVTINEAGEGVGTETAESPSAPEGPPWWTIPAIPLGDNAALHLTAEVSGRYDDNIFLTKNNKVDDEIVSLTPGAEFQFGQNSLGHGSLVYRESFQRYLRTNSANAQLGTGSANFDYDNGNLAAGANASYQQLDQNNRDVILEGKKAIIRSDVLSADGKAEQHFTAKTSASVGADYSRTNYRTAGLTDSSSLSWPMKIYYAASPKIDLSTGVTYRDTKVKGAPRDMRDLYYNIGARGEFTPKLGGEISAGYTTRSFGQSRNNSTLGFDGTLTYAATPNTNCSLTMSRDFRTGALGESLTSTSFSLGVSTALSVQWQAGINLDYQTVGYSTLRKDDYWESGLSASYLFSSRLSASANYIFRHNNSTVSGVEFSDNVLSLSLNFRS